MTPEALAQQLLSMPPRSAQVLGARFLEGLSREQCAARYAVPVESWDLLLLRSARDFDAARTPPAASFEQDVVEAAALRTALEGGAHPLLELTAHAAEVKALLLAAELAAEASPQRARETFLRRAAIVAILALSAYFYRQQQEKEASRHRADWQVQPARKK